MNFNMKNQMLKKIKQKEDLINFLIFNIIMLKHNSYIFILLRVTNIFLIICIKNQVVYTKTKLCNF